MVSSASSEGRSGGANREPVKTGLGSLSVPFCLLGLCCGVGFQYKIEKNALPDYVFSVCRYASRANEHQSNQDALTRKLLLALDLRSTNRELFIEVFLSFIEN